MPYDQSFLNYGMRKIYYTTPILLLLAGCLHSFIDVPESDQSEKAYKLYLYTTSALTGNLTAGTGSRSAIDATCIIYKPASLSCSEIYAYISMSSTNAEDIHTIYTNLPTNAPIYNTDGTQKIADDWADFTDGSIDISLDSAGVTSLNFWTGAENMTDTCSDWTSSTSTDSGWLGRSDQTGSTWWNDNSDTCDYSYPVLCLCISD